MSEEIDRPQLKIEEVLEKAGMYVGPTVGVSMLPMLKNRRDTIVVVPKTVRLKPMDVALYKRGKSYVLHRVLEVTDGGYVIRGDNCYCNERVPENAVIGVLTEFFRKGRHFFVTDEKYLRYVKRRIKTYKVRRFFVRIKSIVKSVCRKAARALGIKKRR